MTTRKSQKQVKKRARPRPAKRGAALAGPAARRGRGALKLAAECTVAGAEALKSQLTARLRDSGPVTLDVSALQRIDTAGLQVLAAFVRDRRTAGRAIAWRGRAPALAAAAGLLGLVDMLELVAEAGQ